MPTKKDDLARSLRRHGVFLKAITSYLAMAPDDTQILDVGCSSGVFLLNAKKLLYQVYGIEPSTLAAKRAQELGLQVFNGFVEDCDFQDNFFDVVTLFEVIEHIAFPASLMHKCFQLLKPGGIMLIGTGNTDSWTVKIMGNKWDYFDMDTGGRGHVSFFNPRSISKLARGIGFEVLSVRTRDVRFFDKTSTSTLIYRSAKVVSEVLNYPSTWFGKGHNMYVYLRKPL